MVKSCNQIRKEEFPSRPSPPIKMFLDKGASRQFYEYYLDIGHNVKDYYQLQKDIEVPVEGTIGLIPTK